VYIKKKKKVTSLLWATNGNVIYLCHLNAYHQNAHIEVMWMLTYKLELMIFDGANSVNMNYTCCAANPSIDTQFKKNRAHSPDPEEKDQRKK
jgi:hypothetical protein